MNIWNIGLPAADHTYAAVGWLPPCYCHCSVTVRCGDKKTTSRLLAGGRCCLLCCLCGRDRLPPSALLSCLLLADCLTPGGGCGVRVVVVIHHGWSPVKQSTHWMSPSVGVCSCLNCCCFTEAGRDVGGDWPLRTETTML
jgi:hypothetical protein